MNLKKIKYLFLLCGCLNMSVMLCGCNTIFQEKVDPYLQVELSKNELETEHYYIKDGTKFISIYKPESKGIMNRATGQTQAIFMCTEDYKTIPTLYKGEVLAYTSKETTKDNVKITRFKDLGYSLSIFGCEYQDGYLCFDSGTNLKKNTSTFTFFENKPSKKINIDTINGDAVTQEMLSNTGIIMGLEKDSKYDISFYSGTYYGTGSIIADTFFMEEYEYFELTDISKTKNGYFAITIPEDFKSGWYYIAGVGMFRYIDQEKGVDIEQVDMNVPYYDSGMSQDEIYSQKYSVNFDTRMKNVSINMWYDATSVEDISTLSGKAYAPDGTVYNMENSMGFLTCPLEEAMAGKWYILIEPKTLMITKQEIVSNTKEQEIKEEEFPIYVEKDNSHFQFIVNFEGIGEINGILTDPEGVTYNFELDKENSCLQYTAAFIKEGVYNIKVFHYADTNILGVDTIENTKTESEILTITE